METPKKVLKNKQLENFFSPMQIPASPMLKKLGYGTGVSVYRLQRSPRSGVERSPWAIKKTNKKILSPKKEILLESRIKREAEMLRNLSHPNIVGFRVFSDAMGKSVLAMEDCQISLGDILEERHEDGLASLPSQNILKMCADVSKALEYLHYTARILHGDVKSHNILVKGDFEICKLCDFGVSLRLDENGIVDRKESGDAQYVGTELWSAPEVLDGSDVICEKADIFSFGLVIYETIALIPPHTWNDLDNEDEEEGMDSSVDTQTLVGTRPPLPEAFELSADYNKIVEIFYICTNDLPEDRPTAKDLARELNLPT